MLTGLDGKVGVVTGAAGGIGRAMCQRLAGEGVRVLAVDVNDPALKSLATEIPGVYTLVADVTTPLGAVLSVEHAVRSFGRMDLFLANAGVECAVRTVSEFDLADFERVFSVNVRAVFLTARAAIRQFTQQGGGRLLLTASVAALSGSPGTSVYTASKHAVYGILRCLKGELGPLGIRVNAIAPGAVDTRMMRALEQGMGTLAGLEAPAMKHAIESGNPLGRYCRPEEVAALAAWLLSDEASYMHGELVTVSGGSAP